MKDKEGVSPKPEWWKDHQSLVEIVSEHFNGGSGDTATLYDIEKFLRAYVKPMQSRIAELEKENQNQEDHITVIEAVKFDLESRLRAANDYLEAQGMNVKF